MASANFNSSVCGSSAFKNNDGDASRYALIRMLEILMN